MRCVLFVLSFGIAPWSLVFNYATAQQLTHDPPEPMYYTRTITTFSDRLDSPPTSPKPKKVSLETKRPALWMDIYTVSFLCVSAILGAILTTWTINARKASVPRKLFDQPGYPPRIPLQPRSKQIGHRSVQQSPSRSRLSRRDSRVHGR